MELRVLGCSGSLLPNIRLTSFLVNDHILLDAGSAATALDLEEQGRVTDVCLTHPHLDHFKDIMFLADNLVELIANECRAPVRVRGLAPVLDAVHEHVLNDRIWPDFTVLPPQCPLLEFLPLEPGVAENINGCSVAAHPVNHGDGAAGFALWEEDGDGCLAYTGDTGVNDAFWAFCNALPRPVTSLIVEASYPNALEELAHVSKHLTPRLLRAELDKLDAAPRILVTHLKATAFGRIVDELQRELKGRDMHVLRQGEVIHL
jgi:ribonuclease BN (tRNA processing enzyme)